MVEAFVRAARKSGQEPNLITAILGALKICLSEGAPSSNDW